MHAHVMYICKLDKYVGTRSSIDILASKVDLSIDILASKVDLSIDILASKVDLYDILLSTRYSGEGFGGKYLDS